MAQIIGGVACSHVPALGSAIAKNLQQTDYFKPFFDLFGPVHAWLERTRPDVAVVFYNDHGLNFFLDNMPAFAVGAAAEYANADEGWGLPVMTPFPGEPTLSWQIIEGLIEAEFDVSSCQRMLVDHACTIPVSLLWPGEARKAIRIVPVCINALQHPIPKPERCYRFGQAVGRAVEAWDSDARVLMVGTGGLSHQLDGERAGFINRPFDLMCLDKIVDDPLALARLTSRDLIEQAGSQGVELVTWLAMRGALSGAPVGEIHRGYHVPISNTAAGLMALESLAATGQVKAA